MIRTACGMLVAVLGLTSWAAAGKPGGQDPPPDADFTIVYSEAESRSLFLTTADGSVHRQITATKNGGAYNAPKDRSPTYSPSGTRIAFLRHPDPTRIPSHLYLINADGTDERLVTEFNIYPSDNGSSIEDTISWSPTEQEIVYARSHFVFAVELATGIERPLGNFGADVSDVDISWTRGEMAFYRFGDIFRIPIELDENGLVALVDSAQAIPVTDDAAEVSDHHPRFSPDGSMIAFTRDHQELVIQHIDTGDEIVVIPTSFWSEITWSPDGNKIAFEQVFVLNSGSKSGRKDVEVLVVDLPSGGVTNITNTTRMSERQPDWRPDPSLLIGE
jgi:Tol biopolymer transport system component